jgi:hypothetical protein
MPDKEITRAMVLKYLPDAQFENMLLGGLRATTPGGGELEIDDAIHFHSGGSEVIRAFVFLCAETYGDNFTVSGPDDFVLSVMQHAALNHISVVPIIEDSGDGCLKVLVALVTFGAVAGIVGGFFGAVFGIPAGAVSSVFVWNRLAKALERQERRRGQQYRYTYPDVLGSDRKADRNQAIKKGWL